MAHQQHLWPSPPTVLAGSVGNDGKNFRADVVAVQLLLNAHTPSPVPWLDVDGKCGPKTIRRIKWFQQDVVGMRPPDGRVDQGGRTLQKLDDPMGGTIGFGPEPAFVANAARAEVARPDPAIASASTILVGIDGTGPLRSAEYEAEMRNSFVSRIVGGARAGRKRYVRGPESEGRLMLTIVSAAYLYIRQQLRQEPSGRVLLTGYSRGGAAVIKVAALLNYEELPVAGMMLFDAVDMTSGMDANVIPANVERVYHAIRSHEAHSRTSFHLDGRRAGSTAARPGALIQSYFYCTHGGMGGVPWSGRPDYEIIHESAEPYPTRVTYGQDRRGSAAVWGWALPWLRAAGFL